jgi:regulatory NSL complex subunit 3
MATQWDQIKTEHCYPKIMSTWSSTDLSFPTHYLFDSSDDNAQHSTQTDEDEDATIDIVGVSDPPTISPRPFDHYKVASVMNECSQHMNLVRLSFDNHELEEERVFGECSFQQQTLLTKCYQILRQDLLLRMTYAGLHQWRSSDVQLHQEEMIKRRFQCDHSAKQFRKVFADIKWDPHLTQWCHRTLMKVLDNDLLPVYMDVLQLLKSKCPALVEQMIHSSSGEGVNEALKLLLKRPWNPAFGLPQIDKEIHFEPSPIFVTLPHSTGLLGSRRLRLWQIQLNSYGKVFPVMPYKTPSESSHKMTLRESMECIIQSTLCRVQELKEQYPSRPILLVSWSTACRVACKVAEVEKVSCLINLGLTVRGLKGSWDITNDPFLQCTTPCIFIVGCDGLCSSVEYTQELRSRMKSTTSLVLINGADDYVS